jgi:hypothetical protein
MTELEHNKRHPPDKCITSACRKQGFHVHFCPYSILSREESTARMNAFYEVPQV